MLWFKALSLEWRHIKRNIAFQYFYILGNQWKFIEKVIPGAGEMA